MTILLKANVDGFYKALCHVLLFAGPQPVVKKLSRCCRCTSTISLPRKKGIAKKVIQTIRAIMISQDNDLVACDFNGTAWRCRRRDNLSTIDEVFSDGALPTPLGPTPLWGPESIRNNWAGVCGFLKPPGSQRFLESEQTWCFSIPRQALGSRSSDQSCHHETWLHLHFVDWNNKWNHQAHYHGNIRLKERLSSSGYGAQKRLIIDVLSDHSLSA